MKMITKEEMQGSWNQLVGEVQKRYSNISGDELAAVKGNANQLAGLIQRKTGIAKEEVEQFLDGIVGGASRSFDRISGAVQQYADTAGEAVRDGYERFQERSHDGYEAARRVVKTSPVESMLVVFGVGLVAGLFAGASIFGRRV
ncbi:MAG TPA: general stress protein CsbD [Planctomycetaceae bacterium]|nr:general stress protein CsbD [Planctomycetaceae bacterium]